MKTAFQLFFALMISLAASSLQAQCPVALKPGQHVIQSGETLYKLSKAYRVSLGDLCAWNQLTVYDTLKLCQVIQVVQPGSTQAVQSTSPATYSTAAPAPVTYGTTTTTAKAGTVAIQRQSGNRHEVRQGETIAALADAYGYTEARFRQFNAMPAGVEVTTGSVLLSTDCNCDRVSSDQIDLPPTHTTPATYNTGSTTQPTKASAASTTSNTSTEMNANELEMVAEINLLRSNPAGYIQYVEKYQRESMLPASSATAAELIAELRNTSPMAVLQNSDCLHRAAHWHAESQRPKGDIDHQDIKGTWPWDRAKAYCTDMTDGNENIVGGPAAVRNSVVVLLLDEGIPTRGHRKNLLNRDWRQVACYAANKVGDMPNCYVQMFGY
jgi:uncharacterized protein YkwD/LysM repeat protein